MTASRTLILTLILPLTTIVTLLGGEPALAGWTEISTCGNGETVRGSAVLNADLDCTGRAFSPVTLEGRLDLNGHTIVTGSQRWAVHCLGNCKITGPGTLTGADGLGVLSRRNLTIKDVTLTGLNVAIKADDTFGKGRAVVQRCTISDVGSGIYSTVPVRLLDTTVSGARSTGLTAGVQTGGCHSRPVLLKRSSVTGSGTDPLCGVDTSGMGYLGHSCADVIACGKRPRLVASTCGTSCDSAALGCTPWGICSAD